jgi:hypothetical protein
MSDPAGGDLHPSFNTSPTPSPSPSTPPPVAPTDRSSPRDFFKETRAKIDADEASRSGYETERATRLRTKFDREAEAREARARGEPPRQATATSSGSLAKASPTTAPSIAIRRPTVEAAGASPGTRRCPFCSAERPRTPRSAGKFYARLRQQSARTSPDKETR